jgi:hypothetical protein
MIPALLLQAAAVAAAVELSDLRYEITLGANSAIFSLGDGDFTAPFGGVEYPDMENWVEGMVGYGLPVLRVALNVSDELNITPGVQFEAYNISYYSVHGKVAGGDAPDVNATLATSVNGKVERIDRPIIPNGISLDTMDTPSLGDWIWSYYTPDYAGDAYLKIEGVSLDFRVKSYG